MKPFLITAICTLLAANAPNAQTSSSKMDWWREARFGMFIHWGVYSQWGGIYHGHQQARGGAEWIMNRCKIPVQEYQDTAKSFNPIHYNADAWVKAAKDAGMKYIILTAKHHDGFALFQSNASKWNAVDATAWRKDIVKPFADACRKYGIKLGFYYSQAQDWNNPGGAAARKEMKEGWPNPDSTQINNYTATHAGHWDSLQMTKTMEQYIDEVAVPQVQELLNNYGDVAVLWWDTPVGMTDAFAKKFQTILDKHPQIITNDRLKRPNYPGNTKTPEQSIPYIKDLDGKDWESCMTMNGSWGYKSWDHNWKTSKKLIQNLVDIASKGGNYLLNIGPQPDGAFPQESIDRLHDIGKWMKINGESIYGTDANPLDSVGWGRITYKFSPKGATLYLSVFEWPSDRQLSLSELHKKVTSASLLATGESLNFTQNENNLNIQLPSSAPDNIASVIKIQIEGSIPKKVFNNDSEKMKTGALD